MPLKSEERSTFFMNDCKDGRDNTVLGKTGKEFYFGIILKWSSPLAAYAKEPFIVRM